MRVLIDTNIIIDFFEKREPFFRDAEKIIEMCSKDEFEGYVAAHTVTNSFYIMRKLPVEERRKRISFLLDFISVIGIDEEKLHTVLRNPDFTDLEDCLQYVCAADYNLDYIVTRDIKDFSGSSIKTVTPKEFLAKMNNE